MPLREYPQLEQPLRVIVTACLALVAVTIAVADGELKGLEQRVAELEAKLRTQQLESAGTRGARLFAMACAACHGTEGRGDGPAASDLDPRPRDLSSRRFRFRSTASGEAPLGEDLERSILQGLPGTAMPAFRGLFSVEELSNLVDFIESLREIESDESPAAISVSEMPSDPPPLEEGRAAYLVSGCWRCHGVNGSGHGPSARGLVDENERPMRTTDFRYDPFKGGRDPESIVRSLMTGLNGAPMPSYRDAMLFAREDVIDTTALEHVLTVEQRRELVELLRSVPSREELAALGPDARIELRDRRLAALAHYTLSFDRRKGLWYRLFRQRPEQEARRR